MNIVDIDSLDDPNLRDYTQLTDVALRKLLEPQSGLYLAESVKVISRALAAGHTPRSVLTTGEWLPTLSPLFHAFPDITVYVGTDEQLQQLTGFHMHRGAIAAMHRPELVAVSDLLSDAQTIVILEDLADHTNVGAVFRSVAALGADAVLVSPSCADPFYRRAVRVSMGAVLQVPWTRIQNWNDTIAALKDARFEVACLALTDDAETLRSFAARVRKSRQRVALVFGSEGSGLSRKALASSDTIVTIPMAHGVDSLNVANAAGITLWAVCGR